MKLFNALLVVALTLALGGCTVGCKIEGAADGVISAGLTKALQCQNSNQILADVSAVVAKAGLCKSECEPGKKCGAIAVIACPIISQIAVTELGATIPASWQCDPAMAKEGLAAALTAACNLIPF